MTRYQTTLNDSQKDIFELEYTNHGEQRIIEREVKQVHILMTLNRPTCFLFIEKGYKSGNKYEYNKVFANGKVLRVVAIVEKGVAQIVTVYYLFDHKAAALKQMMGI
jgi:hypothetical protein